MPETPTLHRSISGTLLIFSLVNLALWRIKTD